VGGLAEVGTLLAVSQDNTKVFNSIVIIPGVKSLDFPHSFIKPDGGVVVTYGVARERMAPTGGVPAEATHRQVASIFTEEGIIAAEIVDERDAPLECFPPWRSSLRSSATTLAALRFHVGSMAAQNQQLLKSRNAIKQ
jgi:hypothetical protein